MQTRQFLRLTALLLPVVLVPASAEAAASFIRTQITPCGVLPPGIFETREVTEPLPVAAPLDISCTTPGAGSAEALSDPIAVRLKAKVAADTDSSSLVTAAAYLHDTFTLHGFGTVPVAFITHGSGTMPSEPTGFGFVELMFGRAPGIDTNTEFGYSDNPSINASFIQEPPGSTFPIAFISPTFTFQVSGSLDVELDAILTVSAANGEALDLFDTAQLVFDLPPGTSVTSVGGFSQSNPGAPVPEPPPFPLLAAAMLLLPLYGRRRSRSG